MEQPTYEDKVERRRRRKREWVRKARQRLQPRYLWYSAKQRAAARGIPFNITVEDVERVWPSDGKCPALGLPLKRKRGRHAGPTSPSLDRINPAWGYEPGNIAVISHRANRLKNDATIDELERLAAWMKSNGLS